MRLFKVGDIVRFCGPSTQEDGSPEPRLGKSGRVTSVRMETPGGGAYKTVFDKVEYITREDYLFEPPEVAVDARDLSAPYGTYVDYKLAEAALNAQPEPAVIDTTAQVEKDEFAVMPSIAEHLICTPASIIFNKQLFVGYANSITSKYAGLILTQDNEVDIKGIVANLNKTARELNQHRINEEKLLTANIKQFKADIDEVIAIFTKCGDDLKYQLANSAQAAKDAKRAEIEPLLAEFLAKSGLPDEYKQHVIIKEEYLNKTFTIKKIKDDIKAEIAQQLEYYNNAKAAKELELAKAREREVVFTAIKAAYPQVNVLLSDLHMLGIDQFAGYFAQQAALIAANPVPATVQLDKNVHDVVEEAPSFTIPGVAPEITQQYTGTVIAETAPKTFTLTMIIKSSNEMSGLQFGLDTVKRAEQLGLEVELV